MTLPLLASSLASASSQPAGISGTLIVAIIALVVSVSTLTWQVAQFLLGGARVKTELHVGALGRGGFVHGPPGGMAPADLAEQGFVEQVYGIQVRNKGRLAVSVTSWAIAFDNGGSVSSPGWPANDKYPLPYRLEPGDEAIWLCPADQVDAAIKAFAAASHPVQRVRARAGLGTGKSVTSKRAIHV